VRARGRGRSALACGWAAWRCSCGVGGAGRRCRGRSCNLHGKGGRHGEGGDRRPREVAHELRRVGGREEKIGLIPCWIEQKTLTLIRVANTHTHTHIYIGPDLFYSSPYVMDPMVHHLDQPARPCVAPPRPPNKVDRASLPNWSSRPRTCSAPKSRAKPSRLK
jgi:hypothetical protein